MPFVIGYSRLHALLPYSDCLLFSNMLYKAPLFHFYLPEDGGKYAPNVLRNCLMDLLTLENNLFTGLSMTIKSDRTCKLVKRQEMSCWTSCVSRFRYFGLPVCLVFGVLDFLWVSFSEFKAPSKCLF